MPYVELAPFSLCQPPNGLGTRVPVCFASFRGQVAPGGQGNPDVGVSVSRALQTLRRQEPVGSPPWSPDVSNPGLPRPALLLGSLSFKVKC